MKKPARQPAQPICATVQQAVHQPFAALPETGFLRLPQIIGQKAVTEGEAASNKKRRGARRPKRPRAAVPALIPVSRSAWWAGVRAGRYPKPLKLSPGTTVWRVEDIRALLARFASDAAA